jgi:hypothetical protein
MANILAIEGIGCQNISIYEVFSRSQGAADGFSSNMGMKIFHSFWIKMAKIITSKVPA